MGDSVRITSVVHVCHDCRAGLEDLGARVEDGETLIALGHACETCAPSGLRLQASHALRVAPSVLREWRGESDALPEGATFVDVAHVASRLVGVGSSDADLIAAVGTAKRLLQLAKGGGA